MKKRHYSMLLGLAASLALLMNQNAFAISFTFNLDTEFSGAQAPGGSPPWLSATFADTVPGTVSLTLSASPAGGTGLTGTENVVEWDFNVASPFVGNLSFSPTSATLPSGGQLVGIQQGLDAFKADGDGLYDILFSFGSGAGKGFGPGDTLAVTITSPSVAGLDASDFNLLSADDGGHGPFFTAAHVQNTTGAGSGGSGWIAPSGGPTVPDAGSTAILLGIALLGMEGLRRRFRTA
jgi:hypothetical protein